MTARPPHVAALLLGSGCCALVYQIAWEREFRLVFGSSTSATAAVLAIFIGGLGLGGLLLGRRADRHPNPLLLYARLETIVALAAAASPLLLAGVRQIYVALGGSATLGLTAGTALRLGLATLVLAVPTFAMGGTLPAAARSVETDSDGRRRTVALLYGLNTLGAVIGCLAATFLLLENLGTRRTLWLAAAINLLVARLATGLSQRTPAPAPEVVPAAPEAEAAGPAAPAGFVLAAAAIVGFTFFLMELVWYRMLGPLLGGTVFTFGLILGVALAGIGIGGTLYALAWKDKAATLGGFAATCLAEAACVALPFALGDDLARLAFQLWSLSAFGFAGLVAGWAVLASIVVLPAAIVAGAQFPLLIALLGRGRREVGRQIGLTYAWNTVGAIVGAIAGGFGLLPLLSAPGCWRLASLILLALGASALALSQRGGVSARRLAWPAAAAVSVLGFVSATGPTAVWRHNALVGRDIRPQAPNTRIQWERNVRRSTVWEADGVESSVALRSGPPALAFIVNGKVDGNARGDAPTQAMSGLLGMLLHPGHPRTAMVVGLGTGSTAGWLGAVPALERVDVVELEPIITEVARACAPVNQSVLSNPRVRLHAGDAREFLLTTPSRYDLVVSEPSNPYRAGIASLFTRDYYEAIAERLAADGIFLQWVQAYSVDPATVRVIYATLSSVFPEVQTWQTYSSDLMLVASRRPLVLDLPRLRAAIREEPYRQGLLYAWRVDEVEGVLARFVAGDGLARAVAAQERVINTDDVNVVEFGFARSLWSGSFRLADVRTLAWARGEQRPPLTGPEPDWQRVEDERVANDTLNGFEPSLYSWMPPDQQQRVLAMRSWLAGDPAKTVATWQSQPHVPRGPTELAIVAEAYAELGDPRAEPLAQELRRSLPAEADAVLARLRLRQGRFAESGDAMVAALHAYRSDPWPLPRMIGGALAQAPELVRRDPGQAPRVLEALSQPYSLMSVDDQRSSAAMEISAGLGPFPGCASVLHSLEPHFPWRAAALSYRYECYAAHGDPLAARAEAEMRQFLSEEPVPFGAGLAPAAAPGPVSPARP